MHSVCIENAPDTAEQVYQIPSNKNQTIDLTEEEHNCISNRSKSGGSLSKLTSNCTSSKKDKNDRITHTDPLKGIERELYVNNLVGKFWECNVCGQRFSENTILAKHLLQHQKENEEVVVNIDALKRKEKRALRQQSRRKVLECNVCGQRFSQNQILAKHMLKHQKENDEVVDNTDDPLKRKEKRDLRQQSHWKGLECNVCV